MLGGQINELEQCHVVWEHPLSFCHFPNLPMEALDGVGGVNQLADLGIVVEVGVSFPEIRPFENRVRQARIGRVQSSFY